MEQIGGGWRIPRILVVEDDLVIARLIERGFVRLGFSVEIATSCAAARAVAGPFQCGVFDIELDDGDGVDLAMEMLSKQLVRTVVFYTGSLDSGARRRALEVGRVIDKLAPFSDLGSHVFELVSGKPVGKA